jgi:hypothetical protein
VGLRDVITDFTPGTDEIGLDAIDARVGLAGDQDFAFVGTNPSCGSRPRAMAWPT